MTPLSSSLSLPLSLCVFSFFSLPLYLYPLFFGISNLTSYCNSQFTLSGISYFLSIYWFQMSSPSKRREMDVMKLMMSDYTVETINDGLNEFNVEFNGPKDSLYEGGVWKIRVELPDAYPYKSPSVGFVNKIFHPNVDELSGSVCLDVINQSWSPMFDLLNVFEVFLPQLLLYPNPSDPLNGDAASLMMKDRKLYDQKVKEYCEKYAKREHIANLTPEDESDEEEEHTTDGESDQSDDEIAGHADL